MAIHVSWQPFRNEQAEGRMRGYVPMVYEKVPAGPAPWEYHVLTVDASEVALPDVVQLNELGQQGWMLAGMLDERVSGHGSHVYYYFARPRIDD